MLATLKEEANKTVTENGAAAYATTGSDCLDLFAVLGALRRESEKIKIAYFVRAYTENPDLAMKILFFAGYPWWIRGKKLVSYASLLARCE